MKRFKNQEDDWLMDAEVQYRINEFKSRWEVSLIFIDTRNPKRVLIQKIGDYRSKRLAEIYARNMQQTAAKDVRGTQKVKKDGYRINNN
ncbi:MAG: hypothetical protein AAF688_07125 [Bacteroidota bacterium]